VAVAGEVLELAPPFERLTVAEAFRSRAGIDLASCDGDAARLRGQLEARGLDADGRRRLRRSLLPRLPGPDRPTLGAPPHLPGRLARPHGGAVEGKGVGSTLRRALRALRGGLELANGFTELTDADEQRRRLENERDLRRTLGRPAYPSTSDFWPRLPRMPAAGGVAVGLDRLLMLLVGAASIDECCCFRQWIHGPVTPSSWTPPA